MTEPKPGPSGQETTKTPSLARNMGLFMLIAYGVGDMVGSGIYATVGKAAAAMGNAVWLAFIASMIAALLTGLSYASIASRYPRAAGAAFVTHHAFGVPFLSYLVGLAVTASGLTSIATACNAFSSNLQKFMPFAPQWSIILVFVAFITFINFWGIRQSMWANLLCTVVEVGGLVVIIALGARYWGSVNYLELPRTEAGPADFSVMLILSGAVLTFYSFVGFEDMLNVAEEVKNPERNMPWGMVIALIIVTVLYMATSITAVSVVDYHRLGDEKFGAPFAQITNVAAPWMSPLVFTGITLFAVANTALINYIMGSRLIYGMAHQKLLPQFLGAVHHRRRTPHVAIGVLALVIVVLAMVGNISQLASATSLLLLTCFILVNGALIVLKLRPNEPKGQFEIPVFVPALGMIACAGLIAARIIQSKGDDRSLLIASYLLAGIGILYLIARPKGITEEALAKAEHEEEVQ